MLGIGAMILLAVGAMLAVGVVAFKIVVPILLLVWLVRWLRRSRHAALPPAFSVPRGEGAGAGEAAAGHAPSGL